MTYDDLLKSHLKFGTTQDDIVKKLGYENILENVVIAPWWEHDMFDNFNFKVEKVFDKIYNFYRDDISFSFIELKEIGAPVMMEYVLPLELTECKNLVFVGSAGSLDENINIGDIVIPEYSICADGASRFLNDNLEDEFLKKEYPPKDFTNNMIEILEKEGIKYHRVPNFSLDTIFAQFIHIDKIIGMGAKTIEMETANLFKCSELLDINISAIFGVSDNTVLKKSLFSGRTEKDRKKRHKTRCETIPKVVLELFKKG